MNSEASWGTTSALFNSLWKCALLLLLRFSVSPSVSFLCSIFSKIRFPICMPLYFPQFGTASFTLSHFFILLLHPTEAGGEWAKIDVRPVHNESGSCLNRSDRSARERFPRQTAGPLWMEIISKLLREADACQKTLFVKVILRHCCPPVVSPLPPSRFLCVSEVSDLLMCSALFFSVYLEAILLA